MSIVFNIHMSIVFNIHMSIVINIHMSIVLNIHRSMVINIHDIGIYNGVCMIVRIHAYRMCSLAIECVLLLYIMYT